MLRDKLASRRYYSRLTEGAVAGFMATLIMSFLMLVLLLPGLPSQAFMPVMIADIAGDAGNVGNIASGILLHFLFGGFLGALFANYEREIPADTAIAKGIVFSLVVWLVMMVVAMPLAGYWFFALAVNSGVAIVTFVFHLIFGLCLGGIFQSLTNPVLINAR